MYHQCHRRISNAYKPSHWGYQQPETLSLPEIFQHIYPSHNQVLKLENILEIILSSSII